MIIYTSTGEKRLEHHESTDSEVIFNISGEEYASIKFELNEWIPFNIGDYVTLFGNRYTLLSKPAPVSVNGSNRYSYTLKFESARAFLDYVNFTQFGADVPPMWDFSTILSPKDYAKLICDNMNRARPTQNWVVGQCIAANPLQHAFSNVTCLGALTSICTLFQTEHWVDMDGSSFRLNIGKLAYITDPTVILEQGYSKGLLSITKQEVSGTKKITRLVALGSEKNLKGTYRDGSNRLMLPNNYYIDADNNVANNPLEGVVTFDDIMPELHHATEDYKSDVAYIAGSQVLDLDGRSWDCISACTGVTPVEGANWQLSEGTVTEFVSQYKFKDKNLTFNPLDPQYIMADGTLPKASFITGDMAGYAFPVSASKALVGGGYELTINSIQDSVDSIIPSATFGVSQYDQYVLIDLYMPETYITKAENRLLAKATEYLAQYSLDQNQYDCPIDEVWATRNSVGFRIGQIVRLYNERLDIDADYRIVGLKRNITSPYKQSVTLSNLPYIQSSYSELKNTVASNTATLKQSGVDSPMFKADTFRVAELNYLKTAIEGSTDIQGGLVATNLLMMKSSANGNPIVGGMSGIENDPVAIWAGGSHTDATDGAAKFIVKKDGSVYGDNVNVVGKFSSGATGERIVIDPSAKNMLMYDDQNREIVKIDSSYGSFDGGAVILKQYKTALGGGIDTTSFIGSGAIVLNDDTNNKTIFSVQYDLVNNYVMVLSDYIATSRSAVAVGQWYRDGEFLKIRTS